MAANEAPGVTANHEDPAWDALPDDTLRGIFRVDGGVFVPASLHRIAGTCKAWRAIAMGNELWSAVVLSRWPEAAGLDGCTSYAALHARLMRADARLAMREPPSELQFMVAMRMSLPDEPSSSVVLSHVFRLSEQLADGTWPVPDLQVPAAILRRAASDHASCDLTCFREFCDWFGCDLRVTAYRPLDQVRARQRARQVRN